MAEEEAAAASVEARRVDPVHPMVSVAAVPPIEEVTVVAVHHLHLFLPILPVSITRARRVRPVRQGMMWCMCITMVAEERIVLPLLIIVAAELAVPSFHI